MLREGMDEIVLIDFGLARNLHGTLQSTRKGVLRGSPYYMSPEQALGEELDPRTDLYSLGIIFYEMLTGRKPYTGTSAIEVLQQHVNAPLPRLPEPLAHHQQLLDGLLAKAREDRFKDAAQVVEAISGMRALREAKPDMRTRSTSSNVNLVTTRPAEVEIAQQATSAAPVDSSMAQAVLAIEKAAAAAASIAEAMLVNTKTQAVATPIAEALLAATKATDSRPPAELAAANLASADLVDAPALEAALVTSVEAAAIPPPQPPAVDDPAEIQSTAA
jgi:serine/threonine protein kinase